MREVVVVGRIFDQLVVALRQPDLHALDVIIEQLNALVYAGVNGSPSMESVIDGRESSGHCDGGMHTQLLKIMSLTLFR